MHQLDSRVPLHEVYFEKTISKIAEETGAKAKIGDVNLGSKLCIGTRSSHTLAWRYVRDQNIVRRPIDEPSL